MKQLKPNAAEPYSAAFIALCGRLARRWEWTDWSDGPVAWRFLYPRGQRSPDQGWKIHVSASAAESHSLLSRLFEPLRDLEAAFKIPRSVGDVVVLNSGDAGVEQLGKVVTVYPRNDDHARDLIVRIDETWPESRGPEVLTDLHVRAGSAVSFRYGVFRPGPTLVSSTGVHEFALAGPDGSRAPDTRTIGGEQSGFATLPPVPGYPPRAYPVELNVPLRVGRQAFIPLVQLRDSPRCRTFLGVEAESLETVVIKVGRPGVAGDARGVDVRDLMDKEYRVLSALREQAGLAPRPLAWLDGDWPVLVMEDFRGEPLNRLPRRERLPRLPGLARALARLHAAGYVHGDVKLENAVRRGAGVGLIDFELAERADGTIRPGGTRGHLPPEVKQGAAAAFSRDVFALGGCLIEAILDFPPGLLPPGTGRPRALLANEGAGPAASLLAELTACDPARRPTAAVAAKSLERCAGQPTDGRPAHGRPSRTVDHRWHRRAASDAARLVSDYARTGPSGTCWRNTHFLRAFDCEAINLGAAGIVLGLLSVDTALGRDDWRRDVAEGARWLAGRPVEGNGAGFFTGNAGVAVALAVSGLRLENERYVAAARRRLTAASEDRREMDLFSGSAGVLWAACLLAEVLGEAWPLDLAGNVARHILDHAGEAHGVPVWAVDAGTDKPYLGCAHGTAGVAMALALWGRLADEPEVTRQAGAAFRGIALGGRTEDGSALRLALGDDRHHAVGSWCHGVGGYLWAILQGVGDDPDLAAEIDWAVACLLDGMAVGTPTYCHGLAGQLELWRMVASVPRYRDSARARAGKVARALRIVHHKVEGRCSWISDDPDVVTPDLWVGFLGPATALALQAAEVPWALLSAPWLKRCAGLEAGREGLP